jgi:hypothetical protein
VSDLHLYGINSVSISYSSICAAVAAAFNADDSSIYVKQQHPRLQFQQQRLRNDVSYSERTKMQQHSAQLWSQQFLFNVKASDLTLLLHLQ